MKDENKNKEEGISRRGFLKRAALAGAALTMPLGLNEVFAAENKQTAIPTLHVSMVIAYWVRGKRLSRFRHSVSA